MEIDQHLFKEEAYRGERISLRFRWLLIAVVVAFIVITYIIGDKKEAALSFIPAGIFLIYNFYLSYLISRGKNIYFLRYFSVSIDIIALSIHIYINSRYFSPIAVATTASIFIYPVLMFLSVLRYDKKLIIYATTLTILIFNLNYILQYQNIPAELIDRVMSSNPMGQVYKSGYLLLLGIFYLKIPEMLHRYIARQKETLEERNEYILNLLFEKKEKELLKGNYNALNELHKELQSKNTEIEEQNHKLNELVKTKDKLISFISHDVKNSFSTMASIIETTKENIASMESNDIVEAMEILFKHSTNNHILFANLLQWAKLQRGQLTLNKEKINLSEFCQHMRKTIGTDLNAKELTLQSSVPENRFVLADRIMLTSIFGNLLGNAIKFSLRGSTIFVKSEESNTSISISIEDQGVGIAEDRLKDIFSIENKKSTIGTEGEKGSGFGLILCKDMIEQNGGEITVKSESGKGSCFTVVLAKGYVESNNY